MTEVRGESTRRACVVVFGREPVPGRVKTRLACSLGEGRAARVYARLLGHTLETAVRSDRPVVLSLAEPATEGWRPPGGVAIEVQAEGDLGERMMDAFQRRFRAGFARVLVVGSDCPGLTCTHIEAGLAALGRVGLVLGPAADGGYWLVGQRSPGCDVFSGVPWSSRRTLESTRVRARSAGVAWKELEVLGDIDTEDDLRMALASDGLDQSLVCGLRADLVLDSPSL